MKKSRYLVGITGCHTHELLPRGRGCATIVYVRTASCQVPSRTTNNRKCSHNNADMRRCSRMRARPFAYTRGTWRQISSAITQNANRARKRGLPFYPPSCPSPHPLPPFTVLFVHLALKIEATRSVQPRPVRTLLNGECTERIISAMRAFRMSGAAFVYGLLGLQIKELDQALSKNANYTHVVGCTLVRKITRVCVGEKMCVDFFLLLGQMQWLKNI